MVLFLVRFVILEKLVWKAQPGRLDTEVQSEKTDGLLSLSQEKYVKTPHTIFENY